MERERRGFSHAKKIKIKNSKVQPKPFSQLCTSEDVLHIAKCSRLILHRVQLEEVEVQ